MSPVKKLSESSVSVKTRTYHDGYSNFYLNCNQKKSPVTSVEKGKDNKETQQPVTESIPLNSSNPSISCSCLTLNRDSTLTNLSDSQHQRFERPKTLEYWPACPDSVELGAPNRFIGNCLGRRVAAQQVASIKIFSLTEDPRKKYCLRDQVASHFKPITSDTEQARVIELVKTADNLDTSSDSESSASSICEVIDLTNPLNLDFQGMDYKNTYGRDEQACQNQIEYRKVRRFKHRRNVKLETAISTEKELQEERISVPKHFAINKPLSTDIQSEVSEADKEEVFGRLIRTEQKPEVRQRLEEEEKNRRERYKQLYIRRKEKLAQDEKIESANQEAAAENKANMLAQKDIQDLVGVLDRTLTTRKMELRQIPKRREFPHTICGALKFRHKLKKSKRILRDRAKVKQEFYTEMGKPKIYPEAQLEISSDTSSPSPTDYEKSTDDEDDMMVGQQGNKFLLRGFHYKIGPNLRGKFHHNELSADEQKAKGCITRDEWFESLVPSKRRVQTLLQKPPADMELFPRELGVQMPQVKSAIKEYRRKQLGRHYDRVMRRNLRIKKPKQIKVKKFSMIGYLYGIGGRKSASDSLTSIEDVIQPGQTLEYMRTRAQIERVKKKIKNRQRMRYLGIPCPQMHKTGDAKSECVDSDSGDSDWIPKDSSTEELSADRPDLRTRGNMPAPEYRESTLRCHPRHPRDYKRLRVPSEQFDDFVQNHDIPVMETLKDDINIATNVSVVKNTEYAKMFEAHHHHDHWDPTQHKKVHVRYSIKIVRPKSGEKKS